MFKIKVGIIILLIVLGALMENLILKHFNASDLRVAFPAKKSALKYEPTKIHLGHEYIFLENVFSPLVEINPKDGTITPGLAKSYEWRGDDLVLEIRTDSKTVSGQTITAEDVEFSLKRLLVLSGNTHGNFKDLVCPNSELKSINETCEGMVRIENRVILKAGKRKSFLVPMLAAIDFAIIPKTSVNPDTLAITNFKETTGPYFVEKDSDDGNIVLKANPLHYRYSKEIPQTIRLVAVDPINKSESLTMLLDGKVDHLTTIDQARPEDVLTQVQRQGDISIHSTHKIRNLSLVFTEKGFKAFSKNQRRLIGQEIRAAFENILKVKQLYEKTEEFFSPLADGGLSPDEKQKVSQTAKSVTGSIKSTKIRIGLIRTGDIASWSDEIRKHLPEADIYQETNVPDFKKYASEAEMPDAFVASTDTGFMEDINLISYTMAAGFFGLTKPDRNKWLAEYMETDNKNDRLTKLRTIHFNALFEGVLIPITVSPFIAVIRKPWRMELSELYANNQLWLIKQ